MQDSDIQQDPVEVVIVMDSGTKHAVKLKQASVDAIILAMEKGAGLTGEKAITVVDVTSGKFLTLKISAIESIT